MEEAVVVEAEVEAEVVVLGGAAMEEEDQEAIVDPVGQAGRFGTSHKQMKQVMRHCKGNKPNISHRVQVMDGSVQYWLPSEDLDI